MKLIAYLGQDFFHRKIKLVRIKIIDMHAKDTCKEPLHRITLTSLRLSGRVLDFRPKGRRFEPHRRHCVVVLEQDTFILA